MDIDTLAEEAQTMWAKQPAMTLNEVSIAMGVVYGDICRQARAQNEGGQIDPVELQKELGNVLFSTIRWCRDLGFDPKTCIELAKQAQQRYLT